MLFIAKVLRSLTKKYFFPPRNVAFACIAFLFSRKTIASCSPEGLFALGIKIRDNILESLQ